MKKISADAGSNSKLPASVQNLIKMIFDVETMKKAMMEFEVRGRRVGKVRYSLHILGLLSDRSKMCSL